MDIINLYDVVNNDNYKDAHAMAFSHRRVSLVGSNQYKPKTNNSKQSDKSQLKCICCGKASQDYIDINFNVDSIGFLGAGYPLYFVFNRLCCTLLVALLIVSKHHKDLYITIFPRKKIRTINESDFMAILMFGIYIFITLFYGWYMSWISIIIDENDTSPEDYSILVSNIPIAPGQNLKIDNQLKRFFQTYYQHVTKQSIQVAEVCLFYNIDPLDKIQKRKLEHLKTMKKVVVRKNITTQQTIKLQQNYHGVVGSEFQDVEKFDTEQMNKQILYRIDKLQQEGFVNNKIMFTGQAIVSFQKQSMKEAVEHSNLAAYFFGKKLIMSKAEHPKNIFWYNLHLDEMDYRIRNILSIVCCSCIFMVSLILQILMTYIKIQITGTKYESRSFNYFSSIVVNLMNIIIPGVFLRFFSRFEGHRTHSQQMLSFSKKCIFLQMMNTLVVPLIVFRLFKINEQMTFVEKQYGVLARNQLFGFVMTIIPSKLILQYLKIFLYRRGIYIEGFINKNLTVKQLCDLYQHMEFDLEKKYCDLLKSIMLAFAFGIALPKVILYALVNMFLSGYIHRYYLVRFSTVKHNVSHVLNQQLFPLLFLGLALFLVSQPASAIKGVLIIISLGLYFLPIISKIKRMVNRQKNQKGKNLKYCECKDYKIFQTDYLLQNPALNHMSMSLVRKR